MDKQELVKKAIDAYVRICKDLIKAGELVKNIYPEFDTNEAIIRFDYLLQAILFKSAVADGDIDPNEMEFIERLPRGNILDLINKEMNQKLTWQMFTIKDMGVYKIVLELPEVISNIAKKVSQDFILNYATADAIVDFDLLEVLKRNLKIIFESFIQIDGDVNNEEIEALNNEAFDLLFSKWIHTREKIRKQIDKKNSIDIEEYINFYQNNPLIEVSADTEKLLEEANFDNVNLNDESWKTKSSKFDLMMLNIIQKTKFPSKLGWFFHYEESDNSGLIKIEVPEEVINDLSNKMVSSLDNIDEINNFNSFIVEYFSSVILYVANNTLNLPLDISYVKIRYYKDVGQDLDGDACLMLSNRKLTKMETKISYQQLKEIDFDSNELPFKKIQKYLTGYSHLDLSTFSMELYEKFQKLNKDNSQYKYRINNYRYLSNESLQHILDGLKILRIHSNSEFFKVENKIRLINAIKDVLPKNRIAEQELLYQIVQNNIIYGLQTSDKVAVELLYEILTENNLNFDSDFVNTLTIVVS